MAQLGFFDADRRLAALSAKGDPLEAIGALVPWESFRAAIEVVVLTPEEARKSNAGRKPIDAIVMFRMLVLQSLYNLSDEQVEFQVRDRLSFTRFLGLGLEDSIPDGTTLWLFREKLARAGLIEKLFARFGHYLEAKGYIARGGQMVDATIVPVPKTRNTKEENDAVKEPAKGQGCALDQEARQEFLRLQEPRERGRPAQVDPALRRQRCVGA
jgi:IS5 family transposase